MLSKISVLISVLAIMWAGIGVRLPHCDYGGVHMVCVNHTHSSDNHKDTDKNHGACVREVMIIAEKVFKGNICPAPAILNTGISDCRPPIAAEEMVWADIAYIYGYDSFSEMESRGPPAGKTPATSLTL